MVDASGRTALMWATIRHNEANIRMLLDAGADPLVQDIGGHTALWYSKWRTVDFSLPYPRGLHGTVFLPRIFPTSIIRLLAAASLSRTGRQ